MMKSMFKIGLVGLTAFVLLVPSSVSAQNMSKQEWRQKRIEKKCKILETREDFLWDRVAHGSSRALHRLQNVINKQNHTPCPKTETIVSELQSNPSFSTLVTAVGAAGLVEALGGANLTVFAPTNQAFAKLPAGTVEALLADKPALQKILTYHVVGAVVPAETAVTLTEATMLNGSKVKIQVKNGELFINDSKVIVNNIHTKNGIIHVIDTVLLP